MIKVLTAGTAGRVDPSGRAENPEVVFTVEIPVPLVFPELTQIVY